MCNLNSFTATMWQPFAILTLNFNGEITSFPHKGTMIFRVSLYQSDIYVSLTFFSTSKSILPTFISRDQRLFLLQLRRSIKRSRNPIKSFDSFVPEFFISNRNPVELSQLSTNLKIFYSIYFLYHIFSCSKWRAIETAIFHDFLNHSWLCHSHSSRIQYFLQHRIGIGQLTSITDFIFDRFVFEYFGK